MTQLLELSNLRIAACFSSMYALFYTVTEIIIGEKSGTIITLFAFAGAFVMFIWLWFILGLWNVKGRGHGPT